MDPGLVNQFSCIWGVLSNVAEGICKHIFRCLDQHMLTPEHRPLYCYARADMTDRKQLASPQTGFLSSQIIVHYFVLQSFIEFCENFCPFVLTSFFLAYSSYLVNLSFMLLSIKSFFILNIICLFVICLSVLQSTCYYKPFCRHNCCLCMTQYINWFFLHLSVFVVIISI